MTDKKTPPFCNGDNVGVVHYKLPFRESMELFIETLTGTCFQLRVSPFEQVLSVKAKIMRLEGIPVSQQHLIWNGMELEDEYCLHDYSIKEGCTLKLVLAMRGGPVNTRRVTVTDDSGRDIPDCIDAGRDDMCEKCLSNKQVTFLVYQEGDQLNFFRVLNRGDGTLTPVSESMSSGSLHNVYERERTSSEQQTLENSVTMNKMKLLKAKMENMNLKKKTKKTAKLKVRPPVGPRPCSGSHGCARHHRLLRVLPQIGHASSTHLPPMGDQPAASSPAAGCSRQSFAGLSSPTSLRQAHLSATASSIYMLQAKEAWDNSVPRKIRLTPKVSRLDLRGPKVMRDCVYPPLAVLPNVGIQDEVNIQSDRLTVPENSTVFEASKPVPFNISKPLSLDVSTQFERGLNSIATVPDAKTSAPLLSQAISSDTISTWLIKSEKQIEIPQHFEFTRTSLQPSPSHSFLRTSYSSDPLASSPSSSISVRGIRVESIDKRSEVISKSEARDITKMDNKASKEPLGSVSNTELLASLAGAGGHESSTEPFALGRLCGTAAHLPTRMHLLQEDLLRKISPLQRTAAYLAPSSSTGLSSSIKRLGTPTHHLPPVKDPTGTKKKSLKHCFLCGKKTGLATSYECRCGNIFCSVHRYAETHHCTYDYKGAGRRFLQETNPIISAPKLPKI